MEVTPPPPPSSPTPAAASPNSSTEHPAASATNRRVRYTVQSVVLIVTTTVVCVMLYVLASARPVRFDLTATGEHKVTERTQRILDGLSTDHELIVTYNSSAADPASAQRSLDLIAAMDRAGDRLSTSIIDVSNQASAEQYRQVLASLAVQHQDSMAKSAQTLGATTAAAKGLEHDIDSLTTSLEQLLETISQAHSQALAEQFRRGALQLDPDITRATRQRLVDTADRTELLLNQQLGSVQVPPIDAAITQLQQGIAASLTNVEALAGVLQQAAAADADALAGVDPALFRRPAQQAGSIRDELAVLDARLGRMRVPDVIRAARVLERTSAILLLGDPSQNTTSNSTLIALDNSTIFPPAAAFTPDQPRPDTRQRAEDMLASALLAASGAPTPIVVFVHDNPVALSPAYRGLRRFADHLSSRGIDLVEWAAAIEDKPTAQLRELRASRDRPIVYFVVTSSGTSPDALQRRVKTIDEVAALIKNDENLLINVGLSRLPVQGQPDPAAAYLSDLGIEPQTGTMLVHRDVSPRGSYVSPIARRTDPNAAHPISGAIDNLNTALLYPIPIKIAGSDDPGLTIEPIVSIPNSDTWWGETEWLALAEQPLELLDTLASPPKPNPSRDTTTGPWHAAVAITRATTSGQLPQRLVVIGSQSWFVDSAAWASDATGVVNPGNIELLDASIAWLAHQDEQIGTSATAARASRIAALTDAQLSGIRWLLIAGLPMGVLVLGAAWRLVRG